MMYSEEDFILQFKNLKFEKDMVNMLKSLKNEQQNAILWMLYHMDFLDLIDSGKVMSEEEEQKWLEQAIHSGDYILQALVLYKRMQDRERTEKHTSSHKAP